MRRATRAKTQARPKANQKPQQLGLFAKKSDLGRIDHGGDTRKGMRKTVRPFSPDASIHLVLKSHRACGPWSLLHHRNSSKVDQIIYTQAKKSGVTVYRHANVGNHLHLLVKSPSKPAFQRFVRTLAGLIARHVTSARKGHATGRYWARTFYSRLISWGREFDAIQAYIRKNKLEALGFGGARLSFNSNGQAVILVGLPESYKATDPLPGIPADEYEPQARAHHRLALREPHAGARN